MKTGTAVGVLTESSISSRRFAASTDNEKSLPSNVEGPLDWFILSFENPLQPSRRESTFIIYRGAYELH
jgi:hypothetical protein